MEVDTEHTIMVKVEPALKQFETKIDSNYVLINHSMLMNVDYQVKKAWDLKLMWYRIISFHGIRLLCKISKTINT